MPRRVNISRAHLYQSCYLPTTSLSIGSLSVPSTFELRVELRGALSEPPISTSRRVSPQIQMPLSEYELKREAILARNRAILQALGIDRPGWAPAEPKPQKQKTEPKAHRPARPPTEPEPATRQSRRLRQQGTEFCPVCLKPAAEGDHTDCQPRDIESDLDAAPKHVRKRAPSGPYDLEQKLSELGLGGLVDFDEEPGERGRADFIVIGSTGNHYIVSLTDQRNVCQCVDFRTRGKIRPCKHLKLLYRQLGISDESGGANWRAAVHNAIESGGDAVAEAEQPDRERVEAQKERRDKATERARRAAGDFVKKEKEVKEEETKTIDVKAEDAPVSTSKPPSRKRRKRS